MGTNGWGGSTLREEFGYTPSVLVHRLSSGDERTIERILAIVVSRESASNQVRGGYLQTPRQTHRIDPLRLNWTMETGGPTNLGVDLI
jgi:hypothetical protein